MISSSTGSSQPGKFNTVPNQFNTELTSPALAGKIFNTWEPYIYLILV